MNDRKKMIELLDKARYEAAQICHERVDCQGCPHWDDRPHCRNSYVADHLLANGVTVQRWIPVTERLPIEEYEEYKEKWQDDEYPGFLVMIEGALLPTHLYFDGEKWYETFGGGKYDHQVTHWMNLPAPPAKD